MDYNSFINEEISRFRADEEDVLAYVQSILRQTNKNQILEWMQSMTSSELQEIVAPYISDKISEELGEREL
ncbi:hypothetical protein [Metabacillus litoralis]|uniref:hypothetical protein n=1 Tax=Metabacillus litoralis TaxID=152268 RepID=UPI001CFC8B7B|nr:hypothetical protein [Metabacillus litoralis]